MRIATLPVLAASLVLPGAAFAQQERHAGFLVQPQLGLGWCTNDTCDEDNPIDAEYGTSLGLGAFVGYRFPFRYVSVGANLQYSAHPVDDEEDWADDATGHSWAFEFEARGHPLVEGLVDPWVGLGFGFAFAGSSWTDARIDDDHESLSLSGPALGISIGIDWWLSDWFAVGVALRYLAVFWQELCIETEQMETTFADQTCEDPEEWEDRNLQFGTGRFRRAYDADELPDLGQFLLTATLAP